jgi:hypothetical protein
LGLLIDSSFGYSIAYGVSREPGEFHWRTVTSALRERYKHPEFAKQLLDERSWLQDVSGGLSGRLGELGGTLDAFRINELIKYLAECIERLDAVGPKESPE